MAAAGKYRTLISIERTRPTVGPSGGTIDSWSGWLERRCRIRFAGFRDQVATDKQNVVMISHVVELRRDSATQAILQEMRVRVLSRTVAGVPRVLHIESVFEADDTGTELELRCTERAVPQ